MSEEDQAKPTPRRQPGNDENYGEPKSPLSGLNFCNEQQDSGLLDLPTSDNNNKTKQKNL